MTINRKIFRAAAIVGFLSLVTKLASAGKELAVANWFGRGDAVDALLIALLPSVLVNLLADAVSRALIPVLARVRENGQGAVHEFLASATLMSLGLLFVSTVIVGFATPYYVPLLGSGFNPAKVVLTRHLIYLLMPFVFLSGLYLIWSSLANAYEQFALPAWTPGLVPLLGLLSLLLVGGVWGIYALAGGMVVGAMMQCLLLGRKLRDLGILVAPRWYGMSSSLRLSIAQYWVAVPAAFLIGGIGFVDQAMAAMLEPGSVAALGYGVKLAALINGLGASALHVAVFPHFCDLEAEGNRKGIIQTINSYVFFSLWAGTVVATFLYVFSRPLISLLFERGAFTAADTWMVSRVAAFYSLQIPCYLVSVLGTGLLSTLGMNQWLALVALMNFVLNIVLNVIFMKYFGVAGIALSTAVISLLSSVAVFLVLYRQANIRLEYKTCLHLLGGGVILLAAIGIGAADGSQFMLGLVTCAGVTIVALRALARRFAYKEILFDLAKECFAVKPR